MVDRETVEAQREWLRGEVAGMVEAGVVNLQQRFYVEHLMGNWGNAQLRGSTNHMIAGLVDLDLSRLMHTRPDMDDELPYEIISRCAPELRGFPLAGDEWGGRTLARAQDDGVAHAPVAAGGARDFPWQHVLYRDWRDTLIREVLRHASLWEGALDTGRLEERLGTPVEPFKSAHVKALFGLVAATNRLRGELRAERDFATTSTPVGLSGSLAATARRWFGHRFASAPRAAEAIASAGSWRMPGTPNGSSPAAARVARELAAGRQELERTEREAERRARELEVRDRLLHHAGEEMRDARSQARAIQRSRAWRLARVFESRRRARAARRGRAGGSPRAAHPALARRPVDRGAGTRGAEGGRRRGSPRQPSRALARPEAAGHPAQAASVPGQRSRRVPDPPRAAKLGFDGAPQRARVLGA